MVPSVQPEGQEHVTGRNRDELPAHRIRPVTRVEELEALRNILELYSPRYVIVGYEQSVASAEALAAESPPVLKHLGNVAGARVYERLTRAP